MRNTKSMFRPGIPWASIIGLAVVMAAGLAIGHLMGVQSLGATALVSAILGLGVFAGLLK